MSISKLRIWLRKMEQLGEADIPIIVIDNNFYTPREIYSHAVANDSIWNKIIRSYPNLDPETVPVELLKQRIREKYRKGKLATIYIMDYPYILTPEQQIREIEAGTELGRKLIAAEEKLVQELTR